MPSAIQPRHVMLRLAAAELTLCRRANHLCRHRPVRFTFSAVSRLGDGVFWYALMAVLPLIYGLPGLFTTAHMLFVSVVGLGLYRLIKTRTARPRPATVSDAIDVGGRVLDRYSFPSGHTLHAVAFTTVAVTPHPALAPVLLPFCAAVALSRVVLGLHYPTDVLSGAALGFALAGASLYL